MSTSSIEISLADPIALAFVGVTGLLLLVLGGRLLRPAIVLGALVASAALGLRLAVAELDGGVLGVPPAVWAIGVPIAGVALALVVYRLCLGLLFALAAASAGFLLTVTLPAAILSWNALPADPSTGPTSPISSAEVSVQEEEVAPTTPQEETPVLERIQSLALAAAESESSALLASSLDGVVRSLSVRIDEGLSSASGWLASQTVGISATLRTLGLVVATVCGLIGLALGLSCPERVARLATAIVGGWLLVAAGSAAWMQCSWSTAPPPPYAVLLAWGALTVGGVVVQSRQKTSPADGKR